MLDQNVKRFVQKFMYQNYSCKSKKVVNHSIFLQQSFCEHLRFVKFGQNKSQQLKLSIQQYFRGDIQNIFKLKINNTVSMPQSDHKVNHEEIRKYQQIKSFIPFFRLFNQLYQTLFGCYQLEKLYCFQRRKQFEKSLKEYLTQYMNFVFMDRERQNVKINSLVYFAIKGQTIAVHNLTLFKNVISLALKQINYLDNEKLSLISYGLTQMTLKNRKKFQEQEKVIWAHIWSRYQTFDIATKRYIAKNVQESDKKHNIKIKVPQNINLFDLSMQQKSLKINLKYKLSWIIKIEQMFIKKQSQQSDFQS